jgi:hypothetical protein
MRYLALAMLVVASIACDEHLKDLTGPTPNLEVTFASIQREIFSSGDGSGRPACTQCHNTALASINGGLNLSEGNAFANLVNVPSTGKSGAVRVIPGDPDNSYLVRKLEGGPDIVGTRMPQTGGPYLTEGQMLVIRRWIRDGANND